MSNGVNGLKSDGASATELSAAEDTQTVSRTPPPPIDAVDIGIVPADVARMAQERGPSPRSLQDLNVLVQDREDGEKMEVEVEDV